LGLISRKKPADDLGDSNLNSSEHVGEVPHLRRNSGVSLPISGQVSSAAHPDRESRDSYAGNEVPDEEEKNEDEEHSSSGSGSGEEGEPEPAPDLPASIQAFHWDLHRNGHTDKCDFNLVLSEFYSRYNPEKIELIPSIISGYRGESTLMLQQLCARYNLSMADMQFFVDFGYGSQVPVARLRRRSSSGNSTELDSNSNFNDNGTTVPGSILKKQSQYGNAREESDGSDGYSDDFEPESRKENNTNTNTMDDSSSSRSSSRRISISERSNTILEIASRGTEEAGEGELEAGMFLSASVSKKKNPAPPPPPPASPSAASTRARPPPPPAVAEPAAKKPKGVNLGIDPSEMMASMQHLKATPKPQPVETPKETGPTMSVRLKHVPEHLRGTMSGKKMKEELVKNDGASARRKKSSKLIEVMAEEEEEDEDESEKEEIRDIKAATKKKSVVKSKSLVKDSAGSSVADVYSILQKDKEKEKEKKNKKERKEEDEEQEHASRRSSTSSVFFDSDSPSSSDSEHSVSSEDSHERRRRKKKEKAAKAEAQAAKQQAKLDKLAAKQKKKEEAEKSPSKSKSKSPSKSGEKKLLVNPSVAKPVARPTLAPALAPAPAPAPARASRSPSRGGRSDSSIRATTPPVIDETDNQSIVSQVSLLREELLRTQKALALVVGAKSGSIGDLESILSSFSIPTQVGAFPTTTTATAATSKGKEDGSVESKEKDVSQPKQPKFLMDPSAPKPRSVASASIPPAAPGRSPSIVPAKQESIPVARKNSVRAVAAAAPVPAPVAAQDSTIAALSIDRRASAAAFIKSTQPPPALKSASMSVSVASLTADSVAKIDYEAAKAVSDASKLTTARKSFVKEEAEVVGTIDLQIGVDPKSLVADSDSDGDDEEILHPARAAVNEMLKPIEAIPRHLMDPNLAEPQPVSPIAEGAVNSSQTTITTVQSSQKRGSYFGLYKPNGNRDDLMLEKKIAALKGADQSVDALLDAVMDKGVGAIGVIKAAASADASVFQLLKPELSSHEKVNRAVSQGLPVSPGKNLDDVLNGINAMYNMEQKKTASRQETDDNDDDDEGADEDAEQRSIEAEQEIELSPEELFRTAKLQRNRSFNNFVPPNDAINPALSASKLTIDTLDTHSTVSQVSATVSNPVSNLTQSAKGAPKASMHPVGPINDDWMQCFDPKLGRVYYHSAARNTSTWVMPFDRIPGRVPYHPFQSAALPLPPSAGSDSAASEALATRATARTNSPMLRTPLSSGMATSLVNANNSSTNRSPNRLGTRAASPEMYNQHRAALPLPLMQESYQVPGWSGEGSLGLPQQPGQGFDGSSGYSTAGGSTMGMRYQNASGTTNSYVPPVKFPYQQQSTSPVKKLVLDQPGRRSRDASPSLAQQQHMQQAAMYNNIQSTGLPGSSGSSAENYMNYHPAMQGNNGQASSGNGSVKVNSRAASPAGSEHSYAPGVLGYGKYAPAYRNPSPRSQATFAGHRDASPTMEYRVQQTQHLNQNQYSYDNASVGSLNGSGSVGSSSSRNKKSKPAFHAGSVAAPTSPNNIPLHLRNKVAPSRSNQAYSAEGSVVYNNPLDARQWQQSLGGMVPGNREYSTGSRGASPAATRLPSPSPTLRTLGSSRSNSPGGRAYQENYHGHNAGFIQGYIQNSMNIRSNSPLQGYPNMNSQTNSRSASPSTRRLVQDPNPVNAADFQPQRAMGPVGIVMIGGRPVNDLGETSAWAQVTSSSGKRYWFNSVTGESTYRQPAPPSNSQLI